MPTSRLTLTPTAASPCKGRARRLGHGGCPARRGRRARAWRDGRRRADRSWAGQCRAAAGAAAYRVDGAGGRGPRGAPRWRRRAGGCHQCQAGSRALGPDARRRGPGPGPPAGGRTRHTRSPSRTGRSLRPVGLRARRDSRPRRAGCDGPGQRTAMRRTAMPGTATHRWSTCGRCTHGGNDRALRPRRCGRVPGAAARRRRGGAGRRGRRPGDRGANSLCRWWSAVQARSSALLEAQRGPALPPRLRPRRPCPPPMTTTTPHHLPTMSTPSDHHHQQRTSHASTPRTPTPTDTCHLFEEARGTVVSTPC